MYFTIVIHTNTSELFSTSSIHTAVAALLVVPRFLLQGSDVLPHVDVIVLVGHEVFVLVVHALVVVLSIDDLIHDLLVGGSSVSLLSLSVVPVTADIDRFSTTQYKLLP